MDNMVADMQQNLTKNTFKTSLPSKQRLTYILDRPPNPY